MRESEPYTFIAAVWFGGMVAFTLFVWLLS